MSACPSLNLLERLLAEELAESERRAVNEHVAACSVCQQQLHELTDDPTEQLWKRQQARAARLAPREGFLARMAALTPEAQPAPLDETLEEDERVQTSNDQATPPWPRIPGYEVLGVLGEGGSSVVYKALQTRLNRMVALKLITTYARPQE